MRLHTLPSLSWSLRTNLGIFFVKAERKEERRKKQGERGRRNPFRDIAGCGSQEGKKAANTFENLLKMQEQRTISYKHDFFAHKVYYASLLCNLETKNCIYRFVN